MAQFKRVTTEELRTIELPQETDGEDRIINLVRRQVSHPHNTVVYVPVAAAELIPKRAEGADEKVYEIPTTKREKQEAAKSKTNKLAGEKNKLRKQ